MIICLTQAHRQDRQRKVKREFRDFKIEPEYFFAIPSIGPHESFNLSTKAILTKFLESGDDENLFLEDDVKFVQQRDVYELAKSQLPEDWDILYLGGNLQSKPERYSDNLFRVFDCWTTHAILYRHKCLKTILDSFPHESERMYDNYLGSLLPKLNAYICSPTVAWQDSGHSDIWGGQVNYNIDFRKSEKLLK